jgi:predicted nucleic acid-binding protein
MRLKAQYQSRVLPVNEGVAELWGVLGQDHPVPPIDGLLAATALYHDLVLVTRYVQDIARTPVQVLNPFTS